MRNRFLKVMVDTEFPPLIGTPKTASSQQGTATKEPVCDKCFEVVNNCSCFAMETAGFGGPGAVEILKDHNC